MERKELYSILTQNNYLKGGTKEACIKVRDFIRNAPTTENRITSGKLCCVSADEFLEAVKTLVAYAYNQDDTIPERWHCECDCLRVYSHHCPGQYNTDDYSVRTCPFYLSEDK